MLPWRTLSLIRCLGPHQTLCRTPRTGWLRHCWPSVQHNKYNFSSTKECLDKSTCVAGPFGHRISPLTVLSSHSSSQKFTVNHICRTIQTSAKTDQDRIPRSRALTLIKDLKEVKHSPAPALALGFSGLVPFISAPVYMIFSQTFLPDIAFAQIAYGATILAFLGGVRWGVTLPDDSVVKPDWTNLGYSVAPSLIAWVGLLLPQPLSIFTLMGGLGTAAYFDTTMYGYPGWFKALRFVLSLVAVLSLWTTFMCKYLIRDYAVKNDLDQPSEN